MNVCTRFPTEAHGLLSLFPCVWRAGGLADRGELLLEGARREVFEETGVSARPLGLLALRQMRRFHFDCPDVYAVCLMRPDPVASEPQSKSESCCQKHSTPSTNGLDAPPPPEIHFDRGEIGDCRWIPVCNASTSVLFLSVLGSYLLWIGFILKALCKQIKSCDY